MSLSISRKIESALLALFAVDATVKQIGPEIRHFHDQAAPKSDHALIVRGVTASNSNVAELAGGTYWTVRIEVMAGGRATRDESGDRLDALYAAVEDILGGITKAQINAGLTGDAAGVAVDGIVHAEPEELYEADLIGRQYNAVIHCHTT